MSRCGEYMDEYHTEWQREVMAIFEEMRRRRQLSKRDISRVLKSSEGCYSAYVGLRRRMNIRHFVALIKLFNLGTSLFVIEEKKEGPT